MSRIRTLLLLLLTSAFAQLNAGVPATATDGISAFTITGTVKDDAGQPMPGVNVIERGTTNGTSTDVYGTYVITISDGNATLVFSFIGFVSQEIPVTNRSLIDVTLVSDIETLSEIVVVGYGEQK